VKARTLSLLLWLAPAASRAQATHIMVPVRETLLQFTQDWGRESALGDLTTRVMGSSDVELRFWGGFGLGGTSATVLRRTDDTWRAWRAEVQRCPVFLPVAVGDTVSTTTLAAYRQQARRNCGDRRPDTLSSATVFYADTMALYPLADANYEDFWQKLKREGILELPPQVPRSWRMLDGYTYVVEVRRGNDYRASVIEHTRPESRADSLVQHLAELIRQGP
jgi:hypothetical protein